MYKEIMDSLIDHVASIDLNGKITFTNQAWKNFSIVNEGDLVQTDIGVNYLEVLKNSKSLKEYNGILDILNGKKAFFDINYACPSPTENRWFSMIVSPLVQQGVIKGATIVHRDISNYEKKRLDAQDILQSMTDAFFSLDETWKIIYINKKAENLLLSSKETFLGKNLWEEFPDTLQTKFEEHYMRTMIQREETSFEEYYEPLQTWFEINAFPQENGGISVYFVNINEKKAKEKKLWETAYHDYLTGIPNRLLLYKNLKVKLEDGSPFVLYFIDINNFKLVNDAYGHEIGDSFLFEVAKRLKNELPEQFFLARFGGDEFVLCNAYVNDQQVQNDTNHILSILEKPFNTKDLPFINTSVSIGLSIFPKDGSSVDSIITAADTAMYEAKKSRGNSWKMYENSMSDSLNRRILIEKSMKEAILTDRFYTVFQPQVNILEKEIIGIEVLSRWNHVELGPISPEEFISIAEESDQIRMLTEHIIDTALSSYNKWKKIHGFSGRISFNVSSTSLNEPSFVSFLLYQLEKHSIPRDILEIEITENLQVFSSSIIHDHLQDIEEAGIRIAIDDFGVGYSNISYISNLPISKIKLDKFFADGIGVNLKSEAILQAMIILANNLKLDVIAEGVETQEQIDFLETNNCFQVQGYFYDKPLNEDQFIQHLQQFGIKYPKNMKDRALLESK